MGLLTTFFKFIFKRVLWIFGVVALATISFSSYNERPDFDSAKIRANLCNYKYFVVNDRVLVCSLYKLSKHEVEIIDKRTLNSLKLYPDYIEEESFQYRIPLSIYVMSVEVLNDKSIFGNKFQKRVVGRYASKVGEVYISMEMFTEIGSTDLQHEIAHYGNDNAGIKDDKINEDLALDFEKYYRYHVR